MPFSRTPRTPRAARAPCVVRAPCIVRAPCVVRARCSVRTRRAVCAPLAIRAVHQHRGRPWGNGGGGVGRWHVRGGRATGGQGSAACPAGTGTPGSSRGSRMRRAGRGLGATRAAGGSPGRCGLASARAWLAVRTGAKEHESQGGALPNGGIFHGDLQDFEWQGEGARHTPALRDCWFAFGRRYMGIDPRGAYSSNFVSEAARNPETPPPMAALQSRNGRSASRSPEKLTRPKGTAGTLPYAVHHNSTCLCRCSLPTNSRRENPRLQVRRSRRRHTFNSLCEIHAPSEACSDRRVGLWRSPWRRVTLGSC
jgi:hypothetical protein